MGGPLRGPGQAGGLMAEGPWYCTCQRAGPLVKECRAIRPRLARTDSREDRRDKNEIIRSPHSAVCRSQADRLELRLALFGFEGTHYTLTYDSVHLPRTFREAMATKRPLWPGTPVQRGPAL